MAECCWELDPPNQFRKTEGIRGMKVGREWRQGREDSESSAFDIKASPRIVGRKLKLTEQDNE